VQRRDLLAYARYGVAYPTVALAAVAGGAWLVGVDVGLAVLFVSMVAASVLVSAYVQGTRAQGGDGTRERRTALGVRADIAGGGPGNAARGPSRLMVVATGLFVQSALATLWLGGLF
jgi:hypothetical protein